MDYITIQQAAEKWNISLPLAQQYCAEGRIPGAQKIGTDWAIPASAPNPADVPKGQGPIPITNPQEEVPPSHPIPMPLLSSPFVPGHCKEEVERIQDTHVRNIAWAEYYYFSGQPEEAAKIAELYLSHDELSLRLSACLIDTYANLSIGQIQRAKHTLAQIQNTLTSQEQLPPQLQATAVFAITAASVLLHLPLPSGLISLKEHLRLLPPGLRMFALYVQAHQTYLEGEYGKSIGIVETAFALEGQQYPIPSIYLHLVAVMDYMSLKQPEHAQAHLLAAWKLAQPDDLIEGFGEHHGLLGGMLEAVLKKDWPEDFRRIIAITYRFSAGWRKVHNPETGHPVADNLTTTEFAAAMLAARGWTNQEIASHLGISPNTVKQYISTALQKLNIKQRKDLKQYMLR